MSPFILVVGADGLRLMYFHLESCGMSVVLRFIVFLIWFWNVFVGFVVDIWKLLLSMKACIFVLYFCVGSMAKEFLLSADVIMASFSMGFICMDCMVLYSDWLVCLVCVFVLALQFY